MAGRGRPLKTVERSNILLRIPTALLEQVDAFKETLEAERDGFAINRTDILLRLIEVGLQTLTQAGQPPLAVPATAPAVLQTAPRPRGRPGTMRARILALLREHPEGLTAEELRFYLKPERPLGDVLQGMVRQGLLTRDNNRKGGRYVAMNVGVGG